MNDGPVTRLKRKMTVENLWMYVLAALSEGPTYAYDVKKRIHCEFGFKPSTITLYSVIYRLKREGLIRQVGNGSKFYEVTDDGYKALNQAVTFMEASVSRIKKHIKTDK